jgi:hypothetical protein
VLGATLVDDWFNLFRKSHPSYLLAIKHMKNPAFIDDCPIFSHQNPLLVREFPSQI